MCDRELIMKRLFIITALLFMIFLSGCASSGEGERTDALTSAPAASEPVSGTTAPPVLPTPSPENNPTECTATLNSLMLKSEENPSLASDLSFVIDEAARTATLTLSYQQYADLATLTAAVLHAVTDDGKVGYTAVLPDGRVNLTADVGLVVTDRNGYGKEYSLIVHRTVNRLPIVNITLKDRWSVGLIDRNLATPMSISIDCTGADGFSSLDTVTGRIRGRGNSTWNWDKKPYKIKLDEAASLLGLDEDRDWILLANYADKSLIRNTVAYEMGRVLDNLFWTPTQYPVDLFINGVYQGVYGLGEHMEVDEGRVDLEEGSDVNTDYFIEIGGMALTGDELNKDYFHTAGSLVRFAAFKSPDADHITNAQKAYITDYFQRAELTIKRGEGYEEYIDVDSFVDWIIIHELCYNVDSCFRRSCFMVKEKDGKLKMGPIWDFDLAFGNFSRDKQEYDNLITPGDDAEDAYIAYNWCTYLLKDPEFCARLYKRWQEVRDDLLNTADITITTYSNLLDGSQQENFKVWQIWDIRTGYQSKWCMQANTYEKQIQYLRDFLTKRAAWMDENLPGKNLN